MFLKYPISNPKFLFVIINITNIYKNIIILYNNNNNNNMSNEPIIITKETTRRLIKDVRDILKEPLDSDGIYYKHDESNILKGYAFICGPTDSQYFGGNYLFEFNFPYDYPHQPPKVEFKTNDGETRFHPNMYRSGKLCLSILNTWRGEQWSGCQSIKSILLTIISIMDNIPLLHEPGFTETHQDVKRYNEIIYFKNFDHCINDIILHKLDEELNQTYSLFKEEILTEFKKNKKKILNILEKKKDEKQSIIRTGIYNMNIQLNWKNTYNNFIKIKV
jgi:ubiquitin-protein ligase